MEKVLNSELLLKYLCDEKSDIVSPKNEEVTRFKKVARLQQSMWRERMGFPTGTHPYRPKHGQSFRHLGSRLPAGFAYESGANFLSDSIRKSVIDRLSRKEPQQTIHKDRLWCDLLSSMPMCFNLFGSFYNDMDSADNAVKTWLPEVPGKVSSLRFEWSPGRRLQGEYLENRSAFDAAFELSIDNNKCGIVGIETKYHEHCKKEKVPSDDRKWRYIYVSEKSGIFKEGAVEKIIGSPLQQIWQDHLLALSMLQHSTGKWGFAKFILVFPEKNVSFHRAANDYQKFLRDKSTFGYNTLESLTEANVLPEHVNAAFTERYLW